MPADSCWVLSLGKTEHAELDSWDLVASGPGQERVYNTLVRNLFVEIQDVGVWAGNVNNRVTMHTD